MRKRLTTLLGALGVALAATGACAGTAGAAPAVQIVAAEGLGNQWVTATCPAGTTRTGGGFVIYGTSNQGTVWDSYPDNNNGWSVYVSTPNKVRAYAVCQY
jgi:hypothetical protein